VAVLDPVVLGLPPGRVARQPARLAQGREAVAAAGQDLVYVGLVAGVPHDDVAGRVEDAVHGQGELHHPQVGAEVAARPEHGLDDEGPDLLGQPVELGVGEPAEVGGALDRLQDHRVPSKRKRNGWGDSG